MKLIITNDGVDLTVEGDGRIGNVESNKLDEYIVVLFNKKVAWIVVAMQSGMSSGQKCRVEIGNKVIEGEYFTRSALDGSPLIKVTNKTFV